MKKYRILAIILSIMAIVVGCKDKEIIEEKPNVKEESMNSEIINLTMIKPTTINPVLNKEESVSYVMNLIYDGLFTIDKDYNIVPQLVEEYGISEDGMKINIKLKDAKWHDETMVTSKDVAFTVDLIQKNQDSPYYPLVQNISSVSVISDKDFVINFKEKYPFSIDTLIFPIVSKGNLGNKSTKEINLPKNNLVGSGPYKIEKYEEREGMILSQNEMYHEDLPNKIKEVNIGIVPDEEAKVSMVMALRSDISKVGLNDLSKFYEKEFNIIKYEGRDYENLIFNYENPFLKDINFRKAIAYAINRDQIVEEAYMADAKVINFPLNSTSKYYDKDINVITYDKDKSKEYLSKAKPISEKDIKEITNNGKLEENQNNEQKLEKEKQTNNQESDKEKPKDIENDKLNKQKEIQKEISKLNLKIIVNKEYTERVKAAYIISENLRDIGIKSTVTELIGEEMEIAIESKNYDLALTGWELSNVPDAISIIQNSGYMDEKLTSYITSLQNAVTESQIKDIYKSIQRYVNENVTFLSLAIKDEYVVTNRRLEGETLPNDFDIYEGSINLSLKK